MAKATLTIKNADGKKLYVAAKLAKVRLGPRTPISKDESLIEVDYRDPENLVLLGRKLENVVGNEFDALIAEEEKKAKEKASK